MTEKFFKKLRVLLSYRPLRVEELKRQLAQLKEAKGASPEENVNLSEENAVKSDFNSTETTSSENKVNEITEV